MKRGTGGDTAEMCQEPPALVLVITLWFLFATHLAPPHTTVKSQNALSELRVLGTPFLGLGAAIRHCYISGQLCKMVLPPAP